MKFVVAAMKFFGKKDGQSIPEFSEECKKLTAEDRAELAPLLAAELGTPVEA